MSIRFGIAGWSYPDWEGIVYPDRLRKADQLPYLAGFFDTIELNNTFYRIPASNMVENWARKVEPYPDFRFTVKLWEGFTHKPEAIQGSERKEFLSAMRPLTEARKLGALLIQFPISFRKSRENCERVLELGSMFQELGPIVEFRHRSWITDDVFELLDENEIGFCNVDEPVFRQMVKPSSTVLGNLGYVRLHGRNYEKWFNKENSRDARYDYLYSENELDEWIPKIEEMGKKAKDVYVIGNNHFRGQAPANILQLKSKTVQGPVDVPEELVQKYPQLEKVARKRKRRLPEQKRLF